MGTEDVALEHGDVDYENVGGWEGRQGRQRNVKKTARGLENQRTHEEPATSEARGIGKAFPRCCAAEATKREHGSAREGEGDGT